MSEFTYEEKLKEKQEELEKEKAKKNNISRKNENVAMDFMREHINRNKLKAEVVKATDPEQSQQDIDFKVISNKNSKRKFEVKSLTLCTFGHDIDGEFYVSLEFLVRYKNGATNPGWFNITTCDYLLTTDLTEENPCGIFIAFKMSEEIKTQIKASILDEMVLHENLGLITCDGIDSNKETRCYRINLRDLYRLCGYGILSKEGFIEKSFEEMQIIINNLIEGRYRNGNKVTL